jgi:NtrC-family two-component system response regulator AlgB
MKVESKKSPVLNILIVDDETNIRKTLSYCLTAEGHSVISVGSQEEAIEESSKMSFHIAFVDLRLGDKNGMELIPILLSDSPWIKIVVITAYASIETAVEAIKRGAADYIAKPFSPDQIKHVIGRISKIRDLESQVAALKENINRLRPGETLESKNPAMISAIEIAQKAAASDAIILLRGESGTGKSVLARAIHNWSERSSKTMAVVSCTAVPSDLLESELFGHTRGAFTGAVKDNPGRIAYCEGGTLFLDEIGDMETSVQAKLLRFIQDKEYERLGEATTRKANVRIIAATNAELEKKVTDGRFREDLFYRLNVISILIPPLRDRREDIIPLAKEFAQFFSSVNHKKTIGFTKAAEEFLDNYMWPGNVRELRNVIERAVILGNDEFIDKKDLPENITQSDLFPEVGGKVPLSSIEELHIRRVIASTSSLQEAADILGIDQATLWRKRRKYGL